MATTRNSEGILVGAIAGMFFYLTLISPATIAALAVRSKIPDTWFSDSIVWYAKSIVIGLSIVIAGVACQMAYKDIARAVFAFLTLAGLEPVIQRRFGYGLRPISYFVVPGTLASLIIGGNISLFNVWIAALTNFAFYFGLTNLAFIVCRRTKK